MKKGSDYRLDYILHNGDQIYTDHAVYTISGEPLGFGGSSILYPARKEGSELEVAIKEWFPRRPANFERRNGIIQPKDLSDTVTPKKNRESFEAELKMGEQIRNTTVRAIHLWGVLKPIKIIFNGKAEDSCDIANGLFAVMERMDQKGKTFNQLLRYISEKPSDDHPLKTGGLPNIHTTALIMEQVLLALQRVHDAGENGYIFGDIQDGNIYFADCRLEQGDIGTGMLLDFGCTKPLSLIEGRKVYEYKGENIFSSQGYIPPEITDPEAHDWQLTQKADIYSAGCLMLRCLLSRYKINTLGDTPYYKDDLVDEVDAADIGCSESDRRLVNHILEKAMQLDPEDRPSVDEMLEEIQKLKRDTAPPTYLLPKAPGSSESFVEGSRDTEIDSVMYDLEINKPVFLWGCGGIGKSEIAIKVAQEFEKHSPKGAYFIHYTVPFDKTQEAMEETVLRMSLSGFIYEPESGMSPEEQRKAEYKKRIRILTEQYAGALLVIDNFDWPGRTLDDLRSEQSYQEITSIGLNLLFTTRNEVPGTPEVKELSRADLLKLMRRWCTDPSITDQQLLDLIEAVDGHTLTVDIIAKTLSRSRRKITPEMMLECFKNSKLSEVNYPKVTLDTVKKGQEHDNVQHREPKTAQIYEHLKALFDLSGLDEQMKIILSCATLLPAGGMDCQLFESCLEEGQGDAFDHLLDCGWLKNSDENVLSIHPIIREVCRGELKPDDEICTPFLENLWERYDDQYYDHIRFHQMADCFASANHTLSDQKGDWASYAGSLYGEIGLYKEGLEHHLQALIISESVFPKNQLILAQSYNRVGGAYGKLGDYRKQLEFCEKALATWEAVLPKNHPNLALSYNNVGHAYGKLGDYRKQLEFCEKALVIRETVLPNNHPNLATSYNNVGCAYRALGDYQKHLEFCEKAMTILETVLPNNHPFLALSYINVGNAYSELGNHQKQLAFYEKALAIQEDVLPNNHSDLALSYNNVGCAYGDLGNHRKQLEFCEKALAIQETVLPNNHPDLAISYANVGYAYGDLGDYEQKLVYLRKAAQCGRTTSMNALANHLIDGNYCTQDYSEALYWLKKSHALGDPKGTNNLGWMYLHGHSVPKDLNRATELFTEAASHPSNPSKASNRHLGKIYLGVHPDAPNFDGVDPVKALHYLEQAKELGATDVDELIQLAKSKID